MPRRKRPSNYPKNKEIITFNASKRMLMLLDNLVALGQYTSRSEAMRQILNEWIQKKMDTFNNVDELLKMVKPKITEIQDELHAKMYKRKVDRALGQQKKYNLTNQTVVDGVRINEYERAE